MKVTKKYQYTKVGRISMTIAKKAHIKAADIMIDENHIKHIGNKHKKELEKLGISVMDFVRLIVSSFTEIREAQENTLYLVNINKQSKYFVAIIQLNYNLSREFWEIKTAIPIRTAVILKQNLIYKKGANPLK
jgi:hypothetical protein